MSDIDSKKIVYNSSSMAESTMCRFLVHRNQHWKGGRGEESIKLLIKLDVSLVFARIVYSYFVENDVILV